MPSIYDSKGNTLVKTRKKPPIREIGGTGRSSSIYKQITLDTDEYLSALRFPHDVSIYEKMGRSDAQVKAILLMLSLPIRSTQWFIRPKDESSKAKKIASFVEECLFGDYGIGLQLGFDDFIRNVTTMFQFGHSIFEKVFEVKKGQYKWKKFAVRPQSTIYDIYYDDVGDLKSIDQYMVHNNWQTINIPVSKLLFFSHDMTQGNVRGTSVLRAAYKHWKIKDYLYKIVNIGIERNFVGTPVLTLPENYTTEDKELADEIVTTLRSSEYGGVRLPDGFILEMFEGKRTLADVQPYIDHQDLAITKSIVAQFMNLGSGNSTSGSFALSSDQSEMFLMMLDSAAKNICNIVNCHAIPELVRYNFASNLFPILSFKPMNSTKLINGLKTLVDGKILLPDDDLEVYIRDMLDLPEQNPAQSREEAIEQFKSNQLSLQQGKQELGNKPPETNKSKNPIENNSKQAQYKDKIKNDNINKKMKDFSNTIKFSEISKESIDILENIIKKQLIKLNEKAETMEINSLSSIKVQYKGELTKLINDILKDELKLSETNIKFTAKSNIISNSISEKVKSMFLNEFIDKPSIEIDNLTQDIINDL
jgi:hypothetical protein